MCSREGSQTRLVFLPLLIIHGYVSLLLAVGRGKLEQPEISISRARDESAEISCKVFVESFQSVAIHWYRQKTNQGLEFLLYVLATPTETFLNKKYKKMKASKNSSASTSILTIYSLEEEDEASRIASTRTIPRAGVPAHILLSTGSQLLFSWGYHLSLGQPESLLTTLTAFSMQRCGFF